MEEGKNLFLAASESNGFQQQERRFWMDIGKTFSTMRVVQQLKVPRVWVEDSPSLKIFKQMLEKNLLEMF